MCQESGFLTHFPDQQPPPRYPAYVGWAWRILHVAIAVMLGSPALRSGVDLGRAEGWSCYTRDSAYPFSDARRRLEADPAHSYGSHDLVSLEASSRRREEINHLGTI